ncbi:MAG TPA: hypothetical protein VIK94_01235 [Bacilli bacterium]
MKNTKTRAIVNYNYSLGDMIVQGRTNSNAVNPTIREVLVKIKRFADTQFFKPGDIVTYNIILTNEGNYPAEEVIVHEDINRQKLVDGSVKLSCIESAQPFKFIKRDNQLEFIISNLQPHRSLYITYQTVVDEYEEEYDNLTSTSTVTVDNNNTLKTDPVVLTKKFAKILCDIEEIDVVYPNKPYDYKINLENIGNEVATDVEVKTLLPDDYEIEKVLIDDEEQNIYVVDDNILKLIVDKVEPHKKKQIKIVGLIKR